VHAQRVLESGWVQPNKRIFHNALVSDHFAIIPTQHDAKHLDEAEAKLFDMIARRFVATFHRSPSSTSPRASASWPATPSRPRARSHLARLARRLRQGHGRR